MTLRERILSQVRDLPPLPSTCMRLMSVLNRPDSTIQQIIETIQYDQAVVACVLRQCNSAASGLRRTVHSLREAVAFLGTQRVLGLVLVQQGGAILSRKQAGYGLAAGQLWRHSVAVAITATNLGARLRVADTNLLFTAGLLHDIGKIVLNTHVADEYVEIMRRVREEGAAFQEAERAVLGCSHDEVGGDVAEHWQLSAPIVRAIRHHHSPDDLQPPDELVDVVYLADCVCMMLGIGLGEDGLSYRADPEVAARRGLSESDIERLGGEVLCELRTIEEVFREGAGRPRAGMSSGATP